MTVETLGHPIQPGNPGRQPGQHVLGGLLAGLGGIEQVRPAGDPAPHQFLGHFRMALQAEYVIAPGKPLVLAPRAGQQALGALRQVEGIAVPLEDREALRQPGQPWMSQLLLCNRSPDSFHI